MLTAMLRAAAGRVSPGPTGSTVWRMTGDFINANAQGYTLGTGAAAWSGGGAASKGGAAYSTGANYNGSTWSAGASLVSAMSQGGYGGTSTAGIIAGGSSGGGASTTAMTYNGTSFTSTSAMSASCGNGSGGFGNQSAFLACGNTGATYPVTSTVYNGSAWSAGANMVTGRIDGGSVGTLSDGLLITGRDNVAGLLSNVQKYNGTAFSSATAFPVTKAYNFGVGSSSTACSSYAGSQGTAPAWQTSGYNFNGTAWSVSTAATCVNLYYPTGNGSTTSAVLQGGAQNAGNSNPVSTNNSQVLVNSSTITGGVWSGIGTPTLIRARAGGFGTISAAISAAGMTSPSGTASTSADSFNGTSWSAAAGTVPFAMQFMQGVGTSTAGGILMGLDINANAPKGNIFTYNGAAWTTGPANATAISRVTGFGTSTTACGVTCGYTAGGTIDQSTYKYNGTAWSTGNNNTLAAWAGAGGGSATAAFQCGGFNNASALQTWSSKYDGTTWTTSGNMAYARAYFGAAGSSSSSGVASGGTSTSAAVSPVPASEFNGTTWASKGYPSLSRINAWSTSSGATQSIANGGLNNISTVYCYNAEIYNP